MTIEQLIELLTTGDRATVIARLLDLSDADRKRLGPKVRGWFTHGSVARVPDTRQALAVVATALGARQAARVVTEMYRLDQDTVDDCAELLGSRAPAWLPDLAELLVDDEGNWGWALAHALLRRGAVPCIEHPAYFAGIVRGVPDYWDRATRLVETIEGYPELIGEPLIRMLDTEGVGRLLAFHDNYCESEHQHLKDHQPSARDTWRCTLATLASSGRLDRARLIETILAVPLRDWSTADLGWYVRFHQELEVGAQEVLQRQSAYMRLLTAEHGPSVKLGQDLLSGLVDNPELNVGELLHTSASVLRRTDKATVAGQLRLLARLIGRATDDDIAAVVRIALDHPRADVREQAAKLLAKLGDEAGRHGEATRPQFVAPTPETMPDPIRVEPVNDPDELVDLMLNLVEEIHDPIDVERAVDGLLRFADARPPSAGPLMDRVHGLTYYSDDPRLAVLRLALGWQHHYTCSDEHDFRVAFGSTVFPTRPADERSPLGVAGRRFTDVVRSLKLGPSPSVALPTHSDGSIDPEALNTRLARLPARRLPLGYELGLALLRVAPGHLDQISPPRHLRREVDRTIRRIRDFTPDWACDIQNIPGLPSYKATVRLPLWRDRRAIPRADTPQDHLLSCGSPIDWLAAEYQYGEYEPRFEQTLAICALMLPHHPDVFSAHMHPYLRRDQDKDRGAGGAVMDYLARTRAPLGAPTYSAIVGAMSAKDARTRAAAQDAIIDLAKFGRLDGAVLGQQAALQLTAEVVVGKRIAGGLAEASRASDAAARPVLEALGEIIHALPGRRDASAFLEPTADLAERLGQAVQLPTHFLEIAEGRASTAAAKAVRRIAAVRAS